MGYLVISRRIGERIKIGENIEILISDIDKKKVSIAIKAPKEIKINRQVRHIDEVQSDGTRTNHKHKLPKGTKDS